jgi:hypothetical protein
MSNDELDTGAHDFAQDGTAQVHRELKVNALRQWLWDHGVFSWEVQLWERGHPELLRRICRDVGVNTPRPDSPTWGMVATNLAGKEQWASLYRSDPRARRTGQRPPYLPEPAPQPQESNA